MSRHQREKKISIFFLPSCPCCCPSAASSSMDLRDVRHSTGFLSPAAHDKCYRAHPPTHSITSEDDSAEVRVLDGSLKLYPAFTPPPLVLSSPGCLLPYLPVWSTSLDIWISAWLRFSPPTLLVSLLSSVPFWLPAYTFVNTQPPYLPPAPPYVAAVLPYPKHLISFCSLFSSDFIVSCRQHSPALSL